MSNFYHYINQVPSYGVALVASTGVQTRLAIHLGRHEFYYSKTGPRLDYVTDHYKRLIRKAEKKAAEANNNRVAALKAIIPADQYWNYES